MQRIHDQEHEAAIMAAIDAATAEEEENEEEGEEGREMPDNEDDDGSEEGASSEGSSERHYTTGLNVPEPPFKPMLAHAKARAREYARQHPEDRKIAAVLQAIKTGKFPHPQIVFAGENIQSS